MILKILKNTKKIVTYILPLLKSYFNTFVLNNFSLDIIKKLFQVCKLRESPCISKQIHQRLIIHDIFNL